jgi:3-dehydroquinate dehydratase-2
MLSLRHLSAVNGRHIMDILILNGPNLNLQGRRDTDVYGTQTFDDYFASLQERFPQVAFAYFQSNIEGELIDAVQQAAGRFDGIVLNAGGYTHTSVALRDAVSAVAVPVVEVHISSILAREEFRRVSLLAPVAVGSIMGFGLDSYRLGVEALLLGAAGRRLD